MKKRLFAAVLAAALVAGSLSACGGDTGSADTTTKAAETEAGETEAAGGDETEAAETEAAQENTYPLTTDGEELTVWAMYSGTIVTDLNDIKGVQKMEEITGVHINWIPVNQDEVSTKLGTLIASGDYPDIIYSGSNDYPGGYAVGIEDGVIYDDMDTLIRNYMPNYMALINSSDEARREATDDNGKMSILRVIVGGDDTAESEGTYQGLAYRADILESLGLDVPTTVDEWHDALLAAQESGIANPFMIDTNGGSALALSWGVSTLSANYLQLDGDTVVLSQSLDGYGEYLETMKQWYAEGLIDPNFTSFNYYLDTPASVQNNEKLLYSLILSGFTGGNYAAYHMVENADAYLQPIVAPAVNEGDEAIQSARRVIAKDYIYITTSCQNPELAAKWLDFQYSKEGEMLNWYGIEGETYTVADDGTIQYTDLVVNNSDGKAPADVLQEYALNQGNCWLGKHDTDASLTLNKQLAGGTDQASEAVAVWSAPETNVYLPEGVTLTDAESQQVASELTALKTMIDEYTINYITGQEVVSFAEFQEELKQYGSEDVLAVYQTAYDRYLAR